MEQRRFGGPDGERVVRLSGNLPANNSDSLRLAAIHCQGLIYMSVAEELRSGQLVPTLTEFRPAELSFDAICPRRQYLSAKARAFIDLVAKNLHAKWTYPDGSH